METLYATGIRRSEAHRLDLYDVDTAAHRLSVRLGKGQRDRIVPLTETAAQWLTRYLTAARPGAGCRQVVGQRPSPWPAETSSPNRGALALSHWPSSLVSNGLGAHLSSLVRDASVADLRPHPRLRFASRREAVAQQLLHVPQAGAATPT